jgi:small subunit ribosomal protein S21
MYQKNKINFTSSKPKFVKKERPAGFHGYYVEVREGEDPMRAFRKIKKQQKEDGFFDEVKAREHFQKPSFKKREKEKLRKQTIRRASRENASWHQIPKQRGHQ